MLISNIGRLVTMEPGPGREGPLGIIPEAAVRLEAGRVSWIGRAAEVGTMGDAIDAEGGVVMPGLVDCHTHLVHAGFRQEEFHLRSQGKSYQEIAAAGGGIMSTVAATRLASVEELMEAARVRAIESLERGTTTIEVKTGYGLSLEAEAKMAGAIIHLRAKVPQTIVGTQLGAHVVPPEYHESCALRSEYLHQVIGKMMPHAARSGAVTAADVFVEEGAFTKDEARAVAGAAKILGLGLHLHVDQFADHGGAALAAELGALSGDHLDHASDKGIRAMAEKGVVGVVLPGASFFAGRGHYPDARRMIDHGLTLAISTDYNPGTNPSLDLWMAATIAVTQMGLTCDEALLAITQHAAAALGLADRGTISVGQRADLIILDAADEHFPLYRYGTNCVRQVIVEGRKV